MGLTGGDKKEQAKLRMQRMRNKQRNKEEGNVTPDLDSVTETPDSVTQGSDSVTSDDSYVTPGVTLWPPSKFLSPEEDMKMQERVIEAMKLMTGSRLGSFRMLSNVFTPNKVRHNTG